MRPFFIHKLFQESVSDKVGAAILNRGQAGQYSEINMACLPPVRKCGCRRSQKRFLNQLVYMSLFFSILTACSPHSCQDFQNEGRAECRKMIARLIQVETKEQLELALPFVKKRFDKMADLMIAARTYQLQHPDEEREFAFDNALFVKELNRIYQIEGGKELMEEAEREALLKLDAFERQILAKKGSLSK